MLGAEFNYTEGYIDEYMDCDRFNGCMRYRQDYPPISSLFKAYIGVKDEHRHYKQPSINELKALNEIPNATEADYKKFISECTLNGIPQLTTLPWKRGEKTNGK
jgi:hypothetical protein